MASLKGRASSFNRFQARHHLMESRQLRVIRRERKQLKALRREEKRARAHCARLVERVLTEANESGIATISWEEIRPFTRARYFILHTGLFDGLTPPGWEVTGMEDIGGESPGWLFMSTGLAR